MTTSVPTTSPMLSAAPIATAAFDDHLSARLLRQRIVVLDEALDDTNGTRIGQLFLLSAEDPRADITLWINSPGGSVPAILAIMDTMRLIPNDVSTLAIGMAASTGQFLLSAGTPGKRFALRHSRILMHQGSSGIGGSAVDIELQAEDLRYTRDTVLALVAEHTGQPLGHDHRLPARPLVHRRGVAGLRLRRRRATLARPGPTAARRLGPSGWRGGTMSTYTIPSVVVSRPRGDRVWTSTASCSRTDRLPGHRGRRRRGQRADRADPAPGVPERRGRDQPLHQLARRLVTAIFAVYDTMQFVRAPVATTCIGQAASTAAILLAAGEPGRRAVLPHSRVLLHQPSAQGQGTIPDLILQAEEVLRVRSETEQVLSLHTGQPLETLRPTPTATGLHPRAGRRLRPRRRRDAARRDL